MKNTFTLVFFSLLMTSILSHSVEAQTTIASYPLTVDGQPSIVDANVNTDPFSNGPNTGGLAFGVNGAFASGWPATVVLDSLAYFQIKVAPNAGYEMNISDLNFGYTRSSTGPSAFELYWSKDPYFANSTRLDSVGFPSSPTQVGDLAGLNIDIADGEDFYLRWYPYNASSGGGTFRIDINNGNLDVLGTVSLAALGTVVSFAEEGSIVNESDGSVNVDVAIQNEDALATSVDVVLVGGDNSLINGFTSQTVNFPGGSAANQTVSISITDDADCNGLSELVFELQNPTGGDNAMVISPSQYTLNIIDNDLVANAAFSDDFESNNLNAWNQGTDGDWTTSATNAINGTYSLKHNLSGIDGESYTSTSLNNLNLDGFETTWRFQMKNGNWDPSGSNRFWVFLTSSDQTLYPNSSTTGYVLGVNLNSTNDLLTLHRIDAGGTVVDLIQSTFDWNANDAPGIEVVRDITGEWTLRIDSDGGFDNLVAAGSAVDDTFTNANYFGTVFDFTSTRAGEFWLDDISITQGACTETYYSQASGDFSTDIWDTTPSGVAGPADFNRYNNFVIQDGHTVSADSDQELKDLTISSAGVLNTSTFTFNLAGSLANSGTLDAGTGTFNFFGPGSGKTISGSNEFFNVTINVPNETITLNNNSDLWGTLSLINGDLDLNANLLTLKSDPSTTAAVASVENGAVIGNVTVERYIQGGVNSWRNLGASVSGTTIQDWNEHFTTTGFPGSDFPNWPSPANRFVSLKSYDETDLGDREIGWKSPTGTANVVADGQGFWMYLGGSELPNTVDVTGSLITGEQTLNLDYTPSLGAFHDGWNLVSNVYAATIDWDSPDFGRTGLEDAIWIWNQDVQQYGSYINGVSLHSVTNEIAHSQSFWVHAESPSPTLTFRESIKTGNNNAAWIKSQEAVEQGIIRIAIEGNGYQDETVLVFNEDATVNFEGTHDAMKFYSANEAAPNIATVASDGEDNYDLGINSVPLSELESFSIPLRTLVGEIGEYTLSVNSIENVANSTCLYIEDLETGEVMLVAEDESLTVELDSAETDDARFMIHVSGPMALNTVDNSCSGSEDGMIVAQGSGEGPWTYTWTNSADEVLKVTENSFTADTLNNLTAGEYFVEVSGSSDVCGTRNESIAIYEPSELSVPFSFEAPACNESIEGQLTATLLGGAGNWNVSLFNDEFSYEVEAVEGVATFEGLSAGNYTLIAQNDCGTVEQDVALFDENGVVADFDLSDEEVLLSEGGIVTTTNTSSNGVLYYWNMGDGSEYFTTEVEHAYAAPGEYTVEMHAVNDFCEDITSKTLTVVDNTVSVDDIADDNGLAVWYDGQQIVVEHEFDGKDADIRVMNILGKTMMATQSADQRTTLLINNEGFAPGVYFVHVSVNDEVKTHKFVINK